MSPQGSVKAGSPKKRDTYGVKLVRGPFLELPPHPDSVEHAADLLAIRNQFQRPLAVDLFCGAGGLSLGLTEAGFDVILGVDNDEDALETHRANHPGLSVNWDLGDEDIVEGTGKLIKKLGVTLIAGGPPCQPFSRAGRSAMRDLVRRGRRPSHDLRKDLWQSFLRIVAIVKPPAVMMENVPDMALDKDMLILRTMVDELEAMGYGVEERLVATSEYGVPQLRHRLILIAIAKGVQFRWPESSAEVTVRGAIGDLPEVEGGWRPDNGDDPADRVASGWIGYGSPTTEFQKRMRRHVPDWASDRLYDHITRPVREDDAIAFAMMDSDTLYSDLDDDLKRYRDDIFDDKYKRLDWNRLSRTITAHIAKDGYWYIHPEFDRTLTVREAARIQTFPDHVRFAGAPSSAFRQIGNAVPPLLGERVGAAILRSIELAEREPLSTTDTAAVLADWFSTSDAAGDAVAQGNDQVAGDPVRDALVEDARGSPAGSLEEHLASRSTRTDAPRIQCRSLEHVRQGQRTGRQNRDGPHRRPLVPGESGRSVRSWIVHDLQAAPGVSPSVADLAVRICPGTGADRCDPVLVTHGVLRVASRYLGTNVDRQNRYSDGRLAVARLVGATTIPMKLISA